MSTKASTESKDEAYPAGGWGQAQETAPSQVREDEPKLARWLATVGFMAVVLGGVALWASATGYRTLLGPGLGVLFVAAGLGCLLFHAAQDRDLQVRRIYAVVGLLFLAAGGLLAALPTRTGPPGSLFLPYGFFSLVQALFFLLPSARNETDPAWRHWLLTAVGLGGAALAAIGFVRANIAESYLLPYDLLLILLGLGYIWAYVGLRGTADRLGYLAALGLGAVGLVVFLVALGRSFLPLWLHSMGWLRSPPAPYVIPYGLLVMVLGLLYAALSAGLCLDNRLVVMVRRELAAYFYSPIAYIVLFGTTAVGLWVFLVFVNLALVDQMGSPLPMEEPIVQHYFVDLLPVIWLICMVPMVTMRLLSEEQRTGTLEVLLTAPLDEVSVVLSKFLAALVFFLLLWLPFWLYLVGLRVEAGKDFDYRPVLGFLVVLACSGAGFLSMGLFFSSLTRHQIGAFILTLGGMVMLTGIYFVIRFLPAGSGWRAALMPASYVDLWYETLGGKLSPRGLMFHLSATIFWLFLTVKKLEARKWS
jgi:ABC-type transport system involved in multi-copper enzyme maturation permease subunit